MSMPPHSSAPKRQGSVTGGRTTPTRTSQSGLYGSTSRTTPTRSGVYGASEESPNRTSSTRTGTPPTRSGVFGSGGSTRSGVQSGVYGTRTTPTRTSTSGAYGAAANASVRKSPSGTVGPGGKRSTATTPPRGARGGTPTRTTSGRSGTPPSSPSPGKKATGKLSLAAALTHSSSSGDRRPSDPAPAPAATEPTTVEDDEPVFKEDTAPIDYDKAHEEYVAAQKAYAAEGGATHYSTSHNEAQKTGDDGAAPVVGGPVPKVMSRRTEWAYAPWSTGFCGCCDHGSSCVETFFCVWCQGGYLYNVVDYGIDDYGQRMNVGACCGSLLVDLLFLTMGTRLLATHMRSETMRRYNIMEDGVNAENSFLTNCCLGCCCPHCAYCQMHREMSVRKESPGGLCAKEFVLPEGREPRTLENATDFEKQFHAEEQKKYAEIMARQQQKTQPVEEDPNAKAQREADAAAKQAEKEAAQQRKAAEQQRKLAEQQAEKDRKATEKLAKQERKLAEKARKAEEKQAEKDRKHAEKAAKIAAREAEKCHEPANEM